MRHESSQQSLVDFQGCLLVAYFQQGNLKPGAVSDDGMAVLGFLYTLNAVPNAKMLLLVTSWDTGKGRKEGNGIMHSGENMKYASLVTGRTLKT